MTCTGLTAVWCPECGDCSCEKLPDGSPCFDSEGCRLHSVNSDHADTVGLDSARDYVTSMAQRQGITLTPNDHETVARFAQYLHGRAAKKSHNIS